MRYFGLIVAALIVCSTMPATPQQKQIWYYCDSARAYYPYVRSCQVPWRRIIPTPQVLSPMNPPSDDPCNPNYAGYHNNVVTAQLAQQQCDTNRRQQQQADEAARQQQVNAEVTHTYASEIASEQQRAIAKAVTRGYQLIPSVKDLILDGRELASRNAKIQISGIYKKSGDSELLYASSTDSVLNTDNYVPLVTDGAQRDLREYLMGFSCRNEVGCEVDIGGHMAMCKNLSLLAANYPDKACLNVEVEIVYRPGD